MLSREEDCGEYYGGVRKIVVEMMSGLMFFLRVSRGGGTWQEDLIRLGFPLQKKNRAHGCGAARDHLGINGMGDNDANLR